MGSYRGAADVGGRSNQAVRRGGVAQGRERVVVGDIATSSINFHDLRHTTRAPTGSAMLSRPCRSSAQFQHNAVESSPRVLQVPVEPLAQLVEHLTFNQGVLGSSPRRLTTRRTATVGP